MSKLEKIRAARGDFYSIREEIANSVTHGIGAGLSVAGLIVMVAYAIRQGDGWNIAAFSIYGASLVVLYLASTLYHSFRRPRLKRFFRLLDHASIYLLIAGTYTPFLIVHMRDSFGWTLLAIIWGLAVLGIIYKLLFIDHYPVLATLGYVAMGWLSVIGLSRLAEAMGAGGMAWLAAGGITYTLGVIFFAWERIPFNHAIWHLFVLGGSVCHFCAIYFYVLPA